MGIDSLVIDPNSGIVKVTVTAFHWTCSIKECRKEITLLSLPQMVNAIKKHQERHKK